MNPTATVIAMGAGHSQRSIAALRDQTPLMFRIRDAEVFDRLFDRGLLIGCRDVTQELTALGGSG